jgi:hypothetical protein
MAAWPTPRLRAMVMARGLAASGTAVIAFFIAAVLPSATWPLIDGDLWWHLRAGEEILAAGSVPRADSWSFTAFGAPWVSQDWLTNTIMATLRGVDPLGETTLSFAFGLLAVAAFGVLWRTIGVRNAAVPWAWRIVWLTVGLVVAAPVLGVRVQVVDLLLSAVVAWLLAHYLADRRRRWVAALPVVAAVWANLHAGWPMLFLLGGAVLVGETADRLLQRNVQPEPLTPFQLRDLGISLLVAFAALAINPNGFALWGYPMDAIGNAVINQYIFEWFPVTAHPRLVAIYVTFVLLAVAPTLALLRRGLRASDALIVIGLTLMPLFAIRFLLLTGPLVVVVAAAALAPDLARSRFGQWTAPKLEHLAVPREGLWITAHLALAALIVILGIGTALARVIPPAQAVAEADAFPAAAVAWLNGEEPGARGFNRYEWGGYLLHQRPGHLVFVDGRAQDVYGDPLLEDYADVIGLRVDPQSVLDRWGVDYVVFASSSDLGAWLDDSAHWERVYTDSLAGVWVRQ